MPEDVVIIGAGPAGVAAAVQCQRFGLRPLLIDEQGTAGGLVRNAFSVENYPGLAPTDGPAFSRLLKAHLRRFDLEVTKGRAKNIAKGEGSYSLETDLGLLQAHTVIIATGTRPKRLDIPGTTELEGRRFFYDVRSADRLKRLKKAAIVGGGEAALDYALTLAKRGARVSILVRAEQLRAYGRLVDLVSRASAIEVAFGQDPLRLAASSRGISITVRSSAETKELELDAVFAAIGRQSAAEELLKGLDADPLSALSTRHPGLFVIGDARRSSLGQVGIAVGEGLAAAGSAAMALWQSSH